MRSQYLVTGWKASLTVIEGIPKCSTCWSTGSGVRDAKESPAISRSGIRFEWATPAAVTMLVAPGPIDDVAVIAGDGNRAPAAPIALSPADGAEVASDATLIVVNAVDPEGDSLTYAFAVYADALLTNEVRDVTGVAEGVGETCMVGFLQRTERVILLMKCLTGWRADDVAGVTVEFGIRRNQVGVYLRSWDTKKKKRAWTSWVFIPERPSEFQAHLLGSFLVIWERFIFN